MRILVPEWINIQVSQKMGITSTNNPIYCKFSLIRSNNIIRNHFPCDSWKSMNDRTRISGFSMPLQLRNSNNIFSHLEMVSGFADIESHMYQMFLT